ncbi:uncharacterized protein LOC116853729 isoform X2 [Odontomachus brunneus]|uniref:uncharacterized protein LOC116853729 isoform X2 n=1 Tax=Odontomachus brunneus TaxID=486640 RepID=UPI0013F22568|nr:uncharacterized protein LOC116853729 isoform X2 [Odontomachus brunneus]
MNNTIECILKCVLKNKRRALQKPTCLLISTEQEMEAFEIIDEDIYEEIVDYLQYIGGFTIKEAINLSFKEVIKDSLMMVYTWFGRERSSKPLYKTRIIMTIYGRHRISIRVSNDKEQRARTTRDYWNDSEEENERNVQPNTDSHNEDD